MAVLSIRNDDNFERFLTSGTSQTTKPCYCIMTLQYALLQGYMRVGYSPLYIIMNSCRNVPQLSLSFLLQPVVKNKQKQKSITNHHSRVCGMLLEFSPLLRLQPAVECKLITALTWGGNKLEVGG